MFLVRSCLFLIESNSSFNKTRKTCYLLKIIQIKKKDIHLFCILEHSMTDYTDEIFL